MKYSNLWIVNKRYFLMKIKMLKKYMYREKRVLLLFFTKIKLYFMKNEIFRVFFISLFRDLNLFEFKLNYSSSAFDNSLSVIFFVKFKHE